MQFFKKFHFFFQALEDDFAYQLEEQERHYGPYLNSALSAEAAAAEVRKFRLSRGVEISDPPVGWQFHKTRVYSHKNCAKYEIFQISSGKEILDPPEGSWFWNFQWDGNEEIFSTSK